MSRLTSAVLFLIAMLVGASAGHSQEPMPENINILTADSVKLKAVFYPSSMQGAPTVMLLHPIGGSNSMKTPEWKNLAESLQKAGYSVIMFDFRGHGDSTTIDDPAPKGAFWSIPTNAINVKAKNKEEILVTDYLKPGDAKSGAAYLPVLCNDIAAVRAYLERRNDARKDCNTSNLIVIGADNGATLGALWIHSETCRYKFTPDPMFPAVIARGKLANKSEGYDIIASVFLTIQPELTKGRSIKVGSQLKSSAYEFGMATLFLYGKGDDKAPNYTKTLIKTLKKEKSEKHRFIGAPDPPLDTNLRGVKLLAKGLGTDKMITKYLDAVVEDRKTEWGERSFNTNAYMWKMPNGMLLKARNDKDKTNTTLNFDDYGRFITQ